MVLKKRKANEDWAIKNRKHRAAKKQHRYKVRNKELDFLWMRTRLKVHKLPPAESLGSKLLFAIRIPGALGEHGIICLEDIVHEITTVGPHFRESSSFLMPFNIKCPKRRLHMKKKAYKDDGYSGNHGDKINELIEKLN